jgi:hypothetical protein
MCSILCWFCLFEKVYVALSTFWAWFMHCQQQGEIWACCGLLNAFRKFSSGFEPFLGFGGHRSDRSECWSCSYVEHRSDRWWWPVWPVRAELMQLLCFHQVVFMHSSRGSLHVCSGSSLLFSSFGLVVCILCLSIVLSRMSRAIALA